MQDYRIYLWFIKKKKKDNPALRRISKQELGYIRRCTVSHEIGFGLFGMLSPGNLQPIGLG